MGIKYQDIEYGRERVVGTVVRLNKRPKPAGAPKRPSAPAPETRRPSPTEPDAPGKPNNAPDQLPVAPARREGERETGAPRRRRSDRRS